MSVYPERVEIDDLGIIVIHDGDGVRLEYARDTSGNMVLGRVLRYPWNWPATEERPCPPLRPLEIAMFVPLVPHHLPWLLKVTE